MVLTLTASWGQKRRQKASRETREVVREMGSVEMPASRSAGEPNNGWRARRRDGRVSSDHAYAPLVHAEVMKTRCSLSLWGSCRVDLL